MTLAQIGPITTVFEATAASVGAGVVLGSVAAGIFRLAAGASRAEVESSAFVSGYAGGAIGAVVVFVDALLRYGGLK